MLRISWRSVLVVVQCQIIAFTLIAQTGFPGYYRFVGSLQKADSLYQASKYLQAGHTFLATSHITVETGIEMPVAEMYYYAASAYALGQKSKLAFHCLDTLVERFTFSDTMRLLTDTTLISLRGDKRWRKMYSRVKGHAITHARHEELFALRTTWSEEDTHIVFQPLSQFARQILMQDTLPWLSFHHELFRVYFSADSYAAGNLYLIREQLSDAYDRAIDILDIEAYRQGISVVLFKDVDEMQAVTGIRAQGGVAYPSDHFALFPYHANRRPQFRHELFHVISNNVWGITYSRLLNEGSAVYADNQCYVENPIYAINAWLMDQGKILPVRSLVEDFDGMARQNDVVAYMQSAGIFKYLFEEYGLEKMKRLWQDGFDAFEEIYDLSLDEFARQWELFIQSIPVPRDIDSTKLLTEGCG
jgi:hypothetical protein